MADYNRLGYSSIKMKKRCFIALYIFLQSFAVNAQDESTIDSLTQIIDNPGSHDTSVCNAYLSWGEEVYLNDPDTALILWQKAYDIAEENITMGPSFGSAQDEPPTLKKRYLFFLAQALNNVGYIYGEKGEIQKQSEYYHKSLKIKEEIGDKKGIAMSLNNIGMLYMNQGDISKALGYYHKSLKIREEIGNKKGIAISLNNIGFIYKNQGDIPKALESFHKSLKIYEEIVDKSGIAYSLNNIGVIYNSQGDIPKALEYFHKSLKIQEETWDKNGIANSLNNIGVIYRNQGEIPKALEYYHKSLKIEEEIGNKSGIAISLNNIGYIYKNKGDIPKALEYYHKSLKIKEEIGDKRGIAVSLKNIGTVELDRGALTEALNYGIRGLQISQEIGSPELISHNSSLLSKVARKQGDFQEALEMYELHILMRDSIKNEETEKESIRQQMKYEFEKAQLVKEQEENEKRRILNEKLKRRDNLQYSVVLICLLVIGVVVAMLGRLSLPERIAEGIIFFSFLILFEFLLVLADPYIEEWSGGAPGFKLLFNAGIAALIFPAHAFFESKMKGRLVK